MNNELISYYAVGGLLIASMIPVVIGIFHFIKLNKLEEEKRIKKLDTPQLKKNYAYHQ
jgi:hypothetical protein